MKNNIIKGALILGIGTFIAKLLGAIYRIPLTSIIGGYGLGLYQMVFPVYSVLLDFSGAGAPNAISKIISSIEGEDKKGVSKIILKKSLKFFSILGAIGSAFMLIFCNLIAKGQGSPEATLAYVTLAPAIFFVCRISCYRGYFQGQMLMKPTAISQIIEQIIKVSLGLVLVLLFSFKINFAVASATFAITVSEIVALIYLRAIYNKSRTSSVVANPENLDNLSVIKRLLKYLLPITLVGIILPLSQVADSFIIVNILKKDYENATALYGLLSGVACTVVHLPVSICYGVATVAIPAVAGEENTKKKDKNANKTIFLTLALAIPFALICYFFAPLAIRLLFPRLSHIEKQISISLLKILSLAIIFLSLLQTTNAVLIAYEKQYYPIISMFAGVTIKILLEFLLIRKQDIGIYGGAIGLIACYFVANLLNLIYIVWQRISNANKANKNR